MLLYPVEMFGTAAGCTDSLVFASLHLLLCTHQSVQLCFQFAAIILKVAGNRYKCHALIVVVLPLACRLL